MPGPSGIVQRMKGKVQADTVFIGRAGVREYVYPAIDIAGGPSTTIPNNGLSSIKNSSGAQVIRLDPPVPGIEKTIAVTTASPGVVITASTGGATPGGDVRRHELGMASEHGPRFHQFPLPARAVDEPMAQPGCSAGRDLDWYRPSGPDNQHMT
jgi:hypothetical protein